MGVDRTARALPCERGSTRMCEEQRRVGLSEASATSMSHRGLLPDDTCHPPNGIAAMVRGHWFWAQLCLTSSVFVALASPSAAREGETWRLGASSRGGGANGGAA